MIEMLFLVEDSRYGLFNHALHDLPRREVTQILDYQYISGHHVLLVRALLMLFRKLSTSNQGGAL